MMTTKPILVALLYAGILGSASAELVRSETFTSSDGFSNGSSIHGTNGWTTARNSPDWISQRVSSAGETLNASTVDSRATFDLAQSWQNTSNNSFNITVDFSVSNRSYSTDTDLFSFCLFQSASGATSGFGSGVRVVWDTSNGGRFFAKGRNGGTTSGTTELFNTATGVSNATLSLRLERDPARADEVTIIYSFDDFRSSATATFSNAGLSNDSDGLFFQMISEDAAKNGGAGIKIQSVEVEKNIDFSDPFERPFIIARTSERAGILKKIDDHDWAKRQYDKLKGDADRVVAAHQADREKFIRVLPLEIVSSQLRFRRNLEEKDAGFKPLEDAERCALLYYLTQDEDYARAAADIFHNVIEALSNTAPFTGNTQAWMTKHILGESRTKTLRLPTTYDLIHPYLKKNPTVYEWANSSGLKTVTYSPSHFDDAQEVFKTYVELIKTRGYAGNNWSANEAQGLVPCALAIDDPSERREALRFYLDRDTSRQDSLRGDAENYPVAGDIWPESLHYSVEVNLIHPILMTMIDRYDPSIDLFGTYPNVALSVARPYQLQFPNDTPPSFGDRGSLTLPSPNGVYEIVYGHAKSRNIKWLTDIYGPLLNEAIDKNQHSRNRAGGKFYYAPLFWGADEVSEPTEDKFIPRTDTLSHAGLVLQRNLSSTNNVNNDLMLSVAGGAYTHSHADGMNIELFGNGHVVGADAAKDVFKTDLHENYYRVFAAHNTIIVNGASRGSGGWQGIGINKVQIAAMEPTAGEDALSPSITYSTTTFEDDKGDAAEATQQRTLALIRTSPTTGYYVDVYRSDSSKSTEYHDYLYHNIGELLEIKKANGSSLALQSEPNRFQSDINDSYQQPGWRYFKDVQNGASDETIKAQFTTGKFSGGTRYMDVHIAGESNREYAKVMAPPARKHGQEYERTDCPTLVVRKTGEAWNRPFAVVYEPHMGSKDDGSVKSVERLIAFGTVYGLKVVSEVAGRTITQYVLNNPDPGETRGNGSLGFELTGRFGVITDNGDGSGSLYLGDGSSLTYQGKTLQAESGRLDATMEFFPDRNPIYKSNGTLEIVALEDQTYGNGGTPGNGTPWTIPADSTIRLQAENFNQGPNGTAYSDTNSENTGDSYRRSSSVDIEPTTDPGGGHNIGWVAAGEWLQYTIDVVADQTYDLKFRYARSPAGASTIRVASNGSDLGGDINAGSSGGWQTYRTVTKRIELKQGEQQFRINFIDGGLNLNWFELAPVLEPEDGPIAHWTFAEGSGTIANDTSGNGHHATLRNGVRWRSDTAEGSHLRFDGDDDRVDTPFTYALSSSADFTWSWKANSWADGDVDDRAIMVGNRYGGTGSQSLEFIKMTRIRGEFANGSSSTTANYPRLPENGWHHYAMVKDGNSYQMYVDGSPHGTATTLDYTESNRIPFRIGGDDDNDTAGGRENEHFQGLIDDVVLYDRALTGGEVQAVRAGTYQDFGSNAGGTSLAAGNSASPTPVGGSAPSEVGAVELSQQLLTYATGQPVGQIPTSMQVAGEMLEFRYTRSQAAIDEQMDFEVQWSNSLEEGSWTSEGITDSADPAAVASDGLESRIATMPLAAGTTRQFMRLKVTP